MSRRGRRYDDEPKLNLKKVFAVIVAIAVVIMFMVGIKTLLTQTEEIEEKVTTITTYYPVYTNEKWGVIDGNGKIIIEPTYTEMITIPDSKVDLFITMSNVDYENNTYKTTVINSKNETKFTQYDLVEAIENIDDSNTLWYEQGVLKVKKDGKYGLIDYTGKIILSVEYDKIEALKGIKNSFIIQKDEQTGLCDNKGNVIISPEYDGVYEIGKEYQNGYIVKKDDKYGVIDFTGNSVLDVKYEEIKPITSSGNFVVKINGKLNVVNNKKEETVLNNISDVKQINGENLVFINNSKCGVMSISGDTKINAEYQDLEYAFNEYYIAKKDGKFGVINISNDIILPFEYSNISYRKEANFIEAIKDEKANSDIYNDQFEKKLEGIISQVNTDKSYIKMRIGEEYKYYNFKLEEIDITKILTQNTLFLSKQNGKYGFKDKDGNIVVDYIYDDATEQNNYGYAGVKKDGKWGAVGSSGTVVIEPSYTLENNILIDFIDKWHISQDINSYYYTDK